MKQTRLSELYRLKVDLVAVRRTVLHAIQCANDDLLAQWGDRLASWCVARPSTRTTIYIGGVGAEFMGGTNAE